MSCRRLLFEKAHTEGLQRMLVPTMIRDSAYALSIECKDRYRRREHLIRASETMVVSVTLRGSGRWWSPESTLPKGSGRYGLLEDKARSAPLTRPLSHIENKDEMKNSKDMRWTYSSPPITAPVSARAALVPPCTELYGLEAYRKG